MILFLFLDAPKKKKPVFKGLPKYRTLKLTQKRQILDYLDEGQSINWIKTQTQTPRSTIFNINKNRAKILQQFEMEKNVNEIKTIRPVTHPELEHALFLWFTTQRKKFIPVSQVIMRKKAEVLHGRICARENCQFKASTGFVQKFRHRHGIRKLAVAGEKLSSNTNGIDEFIKEMMQIFNEKNFTMHHLYNADESGLLWKDIPSETLVLSSESEAPGKKKSKERITITACSNLTGTCRIKLQIIGKSQRPRCFQGRVLPEEMVYEANAKAWQTKLTFKRYFREHIVPTITAYNERNNLAKGAILVLDNASSHSLYDDFKNDAGIHVLFLPPNCTSTHQPMDQSTLQPLKAHYKSKLMESISEDDNWIEALKRVSLYDAVCWVSEAWKLLPDSVLVNSWKNLLNNVPSYHEFRNKSNDECTETHYNDDKDETMLAYEELDDEDIVNIVLGNVSDKENMGPPSHENGENESHIEMEPFEINFEKVVKAFDTLIEYYTQIGDNETLDVI